MQFLLLLDPSASILFHFLFHNRPRLSYHVINCSSVSLEASISSNKADSLEPDSVRQHTWKPPAFPNFKLNTDATIFRSENRGGMGAVIRDERGNEMFTVSKPIPWITGVVTVEAITVRDALIMARELGFYQLEVETDSTMVINLIHQERQNQSEIGQIIEEVKELERTMKNCTFSWCDPRSNALPHSFPSKTCKHSEGGDDLDGRNS